MREDWQLIRLDEYLDIQGGSQPPKSNFIYEPKKGYIQLLQIRDFGQKPVPTYVPINMVTKFCEENDVLIARYGASLGRIVTGLKGAYNVALAKVIDNQELFIKKYLFYLLQTSVLQKPLKLISRTAQNGFAKHEIGHIQLPLCSILEQKAIVAKIEQLFSGLDNGIANLKTAQAKLKIYRQAVLKKAFKGELTKEWREKQKVRFDWIHTTTGEIMPNISSGSTPKAEFLSEDGEIQFLKVYNLNFDGTLNKDKDPVFTTMDIHRAQNKRAITKAGDVLINIVGPPLGKTSMIPLNCNLEYNINQAIVRFRPNEKILPKFLSFFMQNPKTINWLEGTSKATAGQRNVKVTTCRLIPISLPSVSEQNQIVKEIESRLSVCDKIEETIETTLAKSEALRQSILKKAFEGKLLSAHVLENIKNHPEYESAEELLKRIQKERSKQ